MATPARSWAASSAALLPLHACRGWPFAWPQRKQASMSVARRLGSAQCETPRQETCAQQAGAQHEPWSEGEILALEKQAARALQLRSPVPHVIACLTLPAVADPRFRIHYAAVERWARELWATAYGYDAQVLGHRRVPKDSLTHREIMSV